MTKQKSKTPAENVNKQKSGWMVVNEKEALANHFTHKIKTSHISYKIQAELY